MILDVPFKCLRITQDKTHAGLATADMSIDPECVRWLKITGPGLEDMIPGERYVLYKVMAKK
jgi:hypothetical protein